MGKVSDLTAKKKRKWSSGGLRYSQKVGVSKTCISRMQKELLEGVWLASTRRGFAHKIVPNGVQLWRRLCSPLGVPPDDDDDDVWLSHRPGKLVATGDSVLVVERRQQKERATSCEECLNGTGTSSVFALFKEHWQRYQLHGLSTLKTSSSAVANRSRDASCLSVVSFNSRPTKRRVDSFIVSYVGYRTAHFLTPRSGVELKKNALFCCLWRNIDASCYKYFVVFFRNQHRRLLPAICHTHTCATVAVVHRRPCWQHLPVVALRAGTKARYRFRIAISAYPTCIRRPH